MPDGTQPTPVTLVLSVNGRQALRELLDEHDLKPQFLKSVGLSGLVRQDVLAGMAEITKANLKKFINKVKPRNGEADGRVMQLQAEIDKLEVVDSASSDVALDTGSKDSSLAAEQAAAEQAAAEQAAAEQAAAEQAAAEQAAAEQAAAEQAARVPGLESELADARRQLEEAIARGEALLSGALSEIRRLTKLQRQREGDRDRIAVLEGELAQAQATADTATAKAQDQEAVKAALLARIATLKLRLERVMSAAKLFRHQSHGFAEELDSVGRERRQLVNDLAAARSVNKPTSPSQPRSWRKVPEVVGVPALGGRLEKLKIAFGRPTLRREARRQEKRKKRFRSLRSRQSQSKAVEPPSVSRSRPSRRPRSPKRWRAK